MGTSIQERHNHPYRSLCREVAARAALDLRTNKAQDAALWLAGKREDARLSVETTCDAAGYPIPSTERVQDVHGAFEDATEDDLEGEWEPVSELAKTLGIAYSTLYEQVETGRLTNTKAKRNGRMRRFVKRDERLRDWLSGYHTNTN